MAGKDSLVCKPHPDPPSANLDQFAPTVHLLPLLLSPSELIRIISYFGDTHKGIILSNNHLHIISKNEDDQKSNILLQTNIEKKNLLSF